MTTQELKSKIEKMINDRDFVSLRNYLYSNFEVYYFNGESYTKNKNAAIFDRLGSCTNSFLKCSDGFIVDPF